VLVNMQVMNFFFGDEHLANSRNESSESALISGLSYARKL